VIEMPNRRTSPGDVLLDQGMPGHEVRLVLSAVDPLVVRRHLELHRERVMERQVDERNAVDRVEAILVARIDRGHARAVGSTIEAWPERRRRSGGRSPKPS
jgi:hypothetical protein